MSSGGDNLKRLAGFLRDQAGQYKDGNLPPVSWQWMLDCAEAIDSYMRNDADTLDAAFGVKRAHGRPRKDERCELIGLTANALRRKDYSWKEVVDAMSKEGIHLDESTIRAYAKEFAPLADLREQTEALARKLIEDMQSGKK